MDKKYKFDNFSQYTPRLDAEHNSGHYIIDATDYMPLDILIARCRRQNPSAYNAIKDGALANFDGLSSGPADKVDDALEKAVNDAYGVKVSDSASSDASAAIESTTGDAATAESQAASNPVGD